MNFAVVALIVSAVTPGPSAMDGPVTSPPAETASASTIVLEPTPPPGYHRLQPRSVTASSSLRGAWTAVEQNYLPLHAVDDDPATAWIEGASGDGVGESITWVGAPQRALAYCVFLRSGYQKSASLRTQNGRPKRVKLESTWSPEGEVSFPWDEGRRSTETDLADVAGWQRIDMPIQDYATGFRLTVVDVYPGSVHHDTCISDIRVYVDETGTWDAAAEAAAGERMRALGATIASAAKAKGDATRLEYLPRYGMIGERSQVEIPIATGGGAATSMAAVLERAATTADARGKERLARAAQAVADLDRLHSRALADDPPSGWKRVAVTPILTSSALAQSDDGEARTIGETTKSLLSKQDSALLPDSGDTQAKALRALKIVRAALRTPQCEATCRQQIPDSGLRVEDWGGIEWICRSECDLDAHEYGPRFAQLEGVARSQVLVDGAGAAYRRLYRAAYEDVGERDVYWLMRETLVAYQGDEADCIVQRGDDGSCTVVVLDWERPRSGAKSAPRLAGYSVYTTYDGASGGAAGAWSTTFEGKAG